MYKLLIKVLYIKEILSIYELLIRKMNCLLKTRHNQSLNDRTIERSKSLNDRTIERLIWQIISMNERKGHIGRDSC